MAPMAFLTCAFPSREEAIKHLQRHNACMRVGSCGGLLFQLSQYVHEFVCGVEGQDRVEGTRFDSRSSLLAIRCSKDLSWALK